MRHFIGGWAATALLTVYVWNSGSTGGKSVGLGTAFIAGAIFGVLGGVAAWGLLP